MSEDSLITPAIEMMLGEERVYQGAEEIGLASIRRFAMAIGDTNPLYWDNEYAKKSPYHGIVAPPTLIFELNHNIGAELCLDGLPVDTLGRLPGILPPPGETGRRGGNEYKFYQPVRPDDIITTNQKITQIYERQGKAGPMVFIVSEFTYYNQHREKLGFNRETMIFPHKKAL
ncbi:MaoC family dehydratase N-terminal domain-containing protein [Chloroflexota bacterium]